MAQRIEQYEAKNAKLTPSDLGVSAAETAARRIGQFSTQVAAGAREVGRIEQEVDQEQGRQIEAFLRYKGLSQEGGGGGVRVSGRGGDRTLLGTGSNSGITRNAAPPRLAANGRAMTDDQKKLIEDQNRLAAEQKAANLKVTRDSEDEQIKADRADTAANIQQERDREKITPPTDADGNPLSSVEMQMHYDAQDAALKKQYASEDAQRKLTRDNQDAQILQSKTLGTLTSDYKTLTDLTRGATALSGLARSTITSIAPTGPDQNASDMPTVIRGGGPTASQPLVSGQTTGRGETSEIWSRPQQTDQSQTPDASGYFGSPDIPTDTAPAPNGVQQQQLIPAQTPDASGYFGSPDIPTDTAPAPNGVQQQQLIPAPQPAPLGPNSADAAPIDQPSAPAIWSDMTGGMYA